jgi:hypothetical protein
MGLDWGVMENKFGFNGWRRGTDVCGFISAEA